MNLIIRNSADIQNALNHLKQVDTKMAKVIESNPVCTIKPNTRYFHGLAVSIISQQLSSKAADAIYKKVKMGLGGISVARFLSAPRDQLRGYGLSNAKITALHDLCANIQDGRVSFRKIDLKSDREVVDMLVQVKGIGEWTAHMFLMFILARQNVLPTGDLAIRKAVQRFMKLEQMPLPDEVTAIAKKRKWAPFCTVASWYLWRIMDNSETEMWG